MNTRNLRYLVTIAEFGNLSHAAKAMEISQPALSRVLSQWEELCGHPLFVRSGRKLWPTALGSLITCDAQRILDEQNSMMLHIRAVTGNERESIRLATAPNRAAILYSKVFKPFSRRFPETSLHLKELYAGEQPMALLRGEVDLAIGAGVTGSAPSSVRDIPFAREELLVCLPASHPLADREKISLSDLKDTPFVLQGKKHNIRLVADRLFAEAHFSPVVVFESDDVLLLDAMMRQGIGAGLVSKIHVVPCEEASYISLDPPVYQTQHIRFPMGQEITEKERYLASLLMHERLSDPRYEPIHSQEADELFAVADEVEETLAPAPPLRFAPGADQTQAGAVSFDLKILEYIIAIVEEKSLAAAAERFYLAPSVLSRYLKNIEDMVGVSLFHRTHNRLLPNKAGTVLVNSARNMIRTQAEMEKKIEDYRKSSGESISLHLDLPLLPRFQERILPGFTSLHPEMILSPTGSEQEAATQALLGSRADVALFFSPCKSHEALYFEAINTTQLVFIPDQKEALPEGREQVEKKKLPPEGLPRRRVLLCSQGTTLYVEQSKLIRRLYQEDPVIACYGDQEILKELSETGGGDLIFPAFLLSSKVCDRSLALPEEKPYYLILAHNPSRPLSEPVRELMELIRKISWDLREE